MQLALLDGASFPDDVRQEAGCTNIAAAAAVGNFVEGSTAVVGHKRAAAAATVDDEDTFVVARTDNAEAERTVEGQALVDSTAVVVVAAAGRGNNAAAVVAAVADEELGVAAAVVAVANQTAQEQVEAGEVDGKPNVAVSAAAVGG